MCAIELINHIQHNSHELDFFKSTSTEACLENRIVRSLQERKKNTCSLLILPYHFVLKLNFYYSLLRYFVLDCLIHYLLSYLCFNGAFFFFHVRLCENYPLTVARVINRCQFKRRAAVLSKGCLCVSCCNITGTVGRCTSKPPWNTVSLIIYLNLELLQVLAPSEKRNLHIMNKYIKKRVTFFSPFQTQQTKRRRGSNGLDVLDFSVFCQNHEKVCVSDEAPRSSSHIIYKKVILCYFIPSVRVMRMFILQKKKEQFGWNSLKSGGKLTGPCVTPDKLDLPLKACRDVRHLLIPPCSQHDAASGYLIWDIWQSELVQQHNHQQCISHLRAGSHSIAKVSGKERALSNENSQLSTAELDQPSLSDD